MGFRSQHCDDTFDPGIDDSMDYIFPLQQKLKGGQYLWALQREGRYNKTVLKDGQVLDYRETVSKTVREEMMLKLRAMGTTNDLKWFKKIIDRYDVFHVIRMSEPLTMKGTNKYYRMYIELDHIPQKVLDRQRKRK